MTSSAFVGTLCNVVERLPIDLVELLIRDLALIEKPSPQRIALVLNNFRNIDQRHIVQLMLTEWLIAEPGLTGASIGIALSSARLMKARVDDEDSIELVWTGPSIAHSQLRRTEQVLLEVIGSATNHILLVSFALYDVGTILNAIGESASKGVEVSFIVESPEHEAGRLAVISLKNLVHRYANSIKLYVWPLTARPSDLHGRIGSLHVKCCVADDKKAFVSSANITGHAMSLNMELGVLVRGGEIPGAISTHFQEMIRHRDLLPLDMQ